MNKVMAILNSKYFLSSVIGLSILVIIVGVLLVKHANEQAVVYAEQQKEIAKQQINSEDDVLKKFELMAAQAAAELKAAQSTESGPPAKIDFTPESSKEKVSSMKNKNPETGSEDWCEVMMVKPDTEWTKEEQGVFARSCL